MQRIGQPVALVTGASRGIGAETALALAERGYDVALTYRNKAARANEVKAAITEHQVEGLALQCDITQRKDLRRLFATLHDWRGYLDLLVLNASGGLEREQLALDPDYPMRINRDAQVALLNGALPLLRAGGTVVFVTSHWAHLYGKVEQIPSYTPIAETKYAGEQALRSRQEELSERGIRLLVVTGDLIDGTITPKLLQRNAPGLIEQRRDLLGDLPTAAEMGEAIAMAGTNTTLPSGTTIVVGGPLESLLPTDTAF
jgi:NAD(P)-dependent dehydrogenase (short-subunit alcohol dehydrogenase family)